MRRKRNGEQHRIFTYAILGGLALLGGYLLLQETPHLVRYLRIRSM